MSFKKIYSELTRFTFELCVLFGISPYIPAVLQNNVGGDASAIYSWALTILGALVLLLAFLWLKSGQIVEKPFYMSALTFGSVLGLMIGSSALFGMYGYGTYFYLLWRDLPAAILLGLMFVSYAFGQLLHHKMKKEN